jgi:hypothetical protein
MSRDIHDADKTCGNCIWSRWNLTPTGRISKKFGAGRCVIEVVDQVLPLSITGRHGFVPLSKQHRNTIWPECSDCPTWEGPNEKPKRL